MELYGHLATHVYIGLVARLHVRPINTEELHPSFSAALSVTKQGCLAIAWHFRVYAISTCTLSDWPRGTYNVRES